MEVALAGVTGSPVATTPHGPPCPGPGSISSVTERGKLSMKMEKLRLGSERERCPAAHRPLAWTRLLYGVTESKWPERGQKRLVTWAALVGPRVVAPAPVLTPPSLTPACHNSARGPWRPSALAVRVARWEEGETREGPALLPQGSRVAPARRPLPPAPTAKGLPHPHAAAAGTAPASTEGAFALLITDMKTHGLCLCCSVPRSHPV